MGDLGRGRFSTLPGRHGRLRSWPQTHGYAVGSGENYCAVQGNMRPCIVKAPLEMQLLACNLVYVVLISWPRLCGPGLQATFVILATHLP